METSKCEICKAGSAKSDLQILGDRGVSNLNNILGTQFTKGQYVHAECRNNVTLHHSMSETKKCKIEEAEKTSTSGLKRKSVRYFSYPYQQECIFCGKEDKYKGKK